MKPFEKLRNLFRRRPALKSAPIIAEPPPEPVDTRPEWQKKIDAINARCEERKLYNRMTKGGRLITSPDPNEGIGKVERRTPTNGHRPN